MRSTRARGAGRVVSSLSRVRSDPRAPPAPRGRRFYCSRWACWPLSTFLLARIPVGGEVWPPAPGAARPATGSRCATARSQQYRSSESRARVDSQRAGSAALSVGRLTMLATHGDAWLEKINGILPRLASQVASGESHPCARAYATIRRASATEAIFPSITALMLRPALKSLSSE